MNHEFGEGPSITWERFREEIISAHEQMAALEEAVRLRLKREMKQAEA